MALEEKLFVLNLTDFHTEEDFDFLAIYNGSNDTARRLAKLHGLLSPSDILTTGKNMYLRFTSDGFSSRTGFKISLDAYGKS